MASPADPRIDALVTALHELAATGTVPEVAERLAAVAARLLEADGAEVRVLDDAGLRLVGGHGLRHSPPLVLDPPHGMAGQALRGGAPLATVDYLADRAVPRDADDWARAEGVRSAVVAPLAAAHGLAGATVLVFRRVTRPFAPPALAVLGVLAVAGRLALSNARLVESARGLTGAVHGFNNLFAITLLRAEMLLEQETDRSSRRESLEAIRRVALEGRDLVRQARPGVAPAGPAATASGPPG
jgi:GAF domain-containing protein